MANDRILVSTAEMEATIQKYEDANNTLQDSYNKLSSAKDHLDRCYKGPAYLALCAKWANINLNVRSADRAIEAAVQGLRKTIQDMEQGEKTVADTVNALETGKDAPVYL